jgi:PAS domain S-box-containing protein
MEQRHPVIRHAAILGATLLLGPPAIARAQTAAPGLDPRKPISQYVHDVWQIDQGLPQNSILAIIQGRDGYLWLGTEAGLVRFDGVAFTTYNTSNTQGLSDNFVNALLMDRTDTVWAGTWVGGTVRLKGGTSVAAPGGGGSRVNSLFQDRKGTIWAGLDAGLARWVTGEFRVVPGLATRVYTINEATDGTLLAGTDSGVVAWQDGGGRVVPWQPDGGQIQETVWTIYPDRQGGMWIGTETGLYHSVRGALRRFGKDDGLPDGGVNTILRVRNGQLWVGMEGGGLARLTGERFQSFTTSDGLSDKVVLALLEDQEGSLWVGTQNGGLNRFREPILTLYSTRQGLSANVIWSVYGDSRGNQWIGTKDGGLNRLADDRITTYSMRDGLPNNSVFATIETSDGVFWAGTGAGVARLRQGRWEVLPSPFPATRVTAFLEDRSRALWMGGNDGLFRWKDNVFHDYSAEAGIPGVKVRTVVEDSEGSIWIGTHGFGLIRFKDGRFTSFTTKDGLSNNVVEALYQDEYGLWVGTERGLNLVQNERITILPLRSAVFMTDVFRILKDDRGNLWLSSNQGLVSISQAQLLEAVAGARDTVDVREMVSLDGHRRIEFNGASQDAGWKSPDGRLWFPSIKGLVVVDPAHLASNPLPPPVHIEQLLVDGHPVDPGESLIIPPGGGGLEFHYTATSLLIPERVTFRYRLEGYDEDWIDAGTRRVAYYTQVPGGEYRFRVIAANNDGVWNDRGATLPIRLGLHFYETWWFYALAALALLAAILGIFRLRVRRVEQHARDLSGLVDARTRELQLEVAERGQAEERYRHLFDANPQPVWVTDRETLAFLAVNDSAARHYGYSREEFFAMTLADLQPPEQGGALPEWIRTAGDGWRGTSMWQHRKKDGTTIEVEVAAYAFTFAGRPATLIVAADVTERQNLEEKLRQAQKMEAVGQLAGGIAHDLNNVLTAVMAHVDLAVTALPSNDPLLADLTQAQAAAHRGAGMIRKLLGFSRRERLVLRPLRLEQLVSEVAGTLRRMLPESIDVAVTQAQNLMPVAADAGAVQQMLFNLATNARDALVDGGRVVIHVGLATPSDQLMAKQEWGTPGRYVVLTFSDNGAGMEDQVLARIFEPYFSTKPPDQGSGLGMAMVYGLMKQHLGYVLVDSKPGVGTTVRLYFPVTAEAVVVSPPEPGQVTSNGNQTILVVEDQLAVRSAATRALTRFGYRVLSAADGEEGLRMWQANADTVDLVISDAIMPRMGGLALFEAVRRERPGVRFLLTSGYTGEEVRKTAPMSIDLPFLSKPWTVNELLAEVRKALA